MPSVHRLLVYSFTAIDELRIQLGEAIPSIPGSQHNHNATPGGKQAGMMTEQFANQAFATITNHGIPHTPTGNHAKRWQLDATSTTQFTLKNKRPAVDTMFRSADLLKITLLTEAL